MNDVQFSKNDNKCILYHLNIRGLNSKKKSLEKILNTLSPKIVTLNETALRFKQKPKLSNFVSFNRNRTAQIMGGVATFVNAIDKDSFVKLSEGENNDEFLITRHSNFLLPLNIVNIYGEQESRSSKNEIQERWGRLLNEIKKIEKRNELILIIGDLNKHIGCDSYGVKGNHNKISFGGELVRSLIYDGDFICLNNSSVAIGGPFTRFDPSFPHKLENMSCLDLVLASNKLMQFIEKFEIDSERKFSPIRPISKKKSVTSDHFPVIITFSSIFCAKKHKKPQDSFTMWNTNKIGGWSCYKEMTEDEITPDNVFETTQNGTSSDASTEVMGKIDKMLTKIKYSAFGKVKRKLGIVNPGMKDIMDKIDNPEDMNKKLLEHQRMEIEEDLKKLGEIKHSKGKTAAIFSTLNKIRGNKKVGSELVAMKHPDSKDLIFDPKILKTASLDYCVNLLKNTVVDPDYQDEIYIENLLHYHRMKEDDIEPNELKEQDYLLRLKTV